MRAADPQRDRETGEERWLPVTSTVTLRFNIRLDTPEVGGIVSQAKEGSSGSVTGTIVSYNPSSNEMVIAHASAAFRVAPLKVTGVAATVAPISVTDSPLPGGARKMTLMEVDSNALMAPDVTFMHFLMVINRGGGATVAPEELTRFEEWTKEFGQEG